MNTMPTTNKLTFLGERRGILQGAIFGLIFGSILVGLPLSADILTFGVFRTVIIAVIGCAIIAGGFAALAAALPKDGRKPQFGAIQCAGHQTTKDCKQEGDVIPDGAARHSPSEAGATGPEPQALERFFVPHLRFRMPEADLAPSMRRNSNARP